MTEAAFDIDAAYRTGAPIVWRRARWLLQNDADADDVVHEIFARLLAHPPSLTGQAAITTYLYAAATNACLNHMRNHKRRTGLLDRFWRQPTPDAAVAHNLIVFREALAVLPDPLAALVIYAHVDEMTHDEIAALVGLPRRTVTEKLARAQALMQQHQKAP